MLTHDPKLDDAALTAALRLGRPPTSARWAAAARRSSAASGCSRPACRRTSSTRIAAPIGLDLGGLTAEETALSIMAEIVAVRNGREGGRLSQASGRIHEVGA